MLYKVILLLFILASCGKNPFDDDHKHNPFNRDPRTNITSDATFDPYVEQFEEDYGQYIGDIPINFAKLEDQKIGVCYTWDSGHAEVEIDPDFWKVATELEKKALIYHELGHCELGRDHYDDIREDNCAVSIMNWIIVGDFCLNIHMDEYIKELFE